MSRTNAYYVSWLSGYRYVAPDAWELHRLQRRWNCAVDVTRHARPNRKAKTAERYGLWRSLRGFYQSEASASSSIAKLSQDKTYSVFTVPLFDDGWLA